MEGVLDGPKTIAAPSRGRSSVVNQNLGTTYYKHAELFMKRRQYAEAEPLLQEAFRLRPNDADVMNKLGSALWELGRPAEAESLLSRAHEIRPDDVWILNNLGLALGPGTAQRSGWVLSEGASAPAGLDRRADEPWGRAVGSGPV